MAIEAVVLTGGASRRMGRDKASLPVAGTPMGLRIAQSLRDAGIPVTVLGREPLEGFPFLADAQAFGGPLAALRAFRSTEPAVFVAACDMPRFDPRIVEFLQAQLGGHDAAIPALEGRLQPLCALYTEGALARLREPRFADVQAVMRWVDTLSIAQVETGFEPEWIRGANTPADLP
ncbi:MAG: molybdenum cofactor guanylyltransferase [Fimbriimonadaceae bacterium]|nr:molybdenum cofactor guanylyltransferase [Fimbriimonadaceae bacterium]